MKNFQGYLAGLTERKLSERIIISMFETEIYKMQPLYYFSFQKKIYFLISILYYITMSFLTRKFKLVHMIIKKSDHYKHKKMKIIYLEKFWIPCIQLVGFGWYFWHRVAVLFEHGNRSSWDFLIDIYCTQAKEKTFRMKQKRVNFEYLIRGLAIIGLCFKRSFSFLFAR